MVELIRIAYLPTITLGVIRIGDIEFKTVELPWRRNEQDVSCIPEGRYAMRVFYSAKRKMNVVSVEGVQDRTAIQIHPANFPKDLKGCIGIGESFLSDYSGVINSRDSFRRFMDSITLPDVLIIRFARYAQDLQSY